MIMNLIEDDDYRTYTINPYKNSSSEFFGVSLKGKAKDYIRAHKAFQSVIQKGKIHNVSYKTGVKDELKRGKIKFLNVVQTNIMLDTIVEVTDEKGDRGNEILFSK